MSDTFKAYSFVKPKFKVSNPYGLTDEQIKSMQSIPYWAIPQGTQIEAYGRIGEDLGTLGSFSKENPNTVEWYDNSQNTLLHEVEHLRQNKYKDLYNKNASGYAIGAIGNTDQFNLTKKLKTIPNKKLVKDYNFGDNWNENTKETFANLSAYIQENMQKGIEFGNTPLAKELGITKGSKEMEYIYTHIIPGQDKLYQVPEENSFLDYFK